MNEQNSENTPTVLVQVIQSLEDEIIKCSEEIKVADEPKKTELMGIVNKAYKEVYRLFKETGEVPNETLFRVSEIYLNTANYYKEYLKTKNNEVV
ncbi:MAG: hypothetical protein KKF46_07620 [Nanoarchaeota archaeon]|nr:hypothetical protein [Nanoarchaeota archaeon]MBU1322196.1 hypothetical protein [Nanoarchaeota archaeon]MBU1597737.1 hypothetical protein [Nanoarchaeota archaeon]MBU2442001.1 hypothetical protein [Nanoarchaeota archaeon]